ncbi:pyruvate kinase [Hellea sp.]|jgi:pyruvate kinase|nr:pyruvate kinase [Hellea sp.]MDA8888660.1 pyruvate kinase [Hellea sp.]MDB4844362.1 pyruvate kinase [Hellea sp.]MDC1062087.1 pyruvate kinase [Hellea sp.]MDC1089444.1 pyruvate kinase [Hellea sp.]
MKHRSAKILATIGPASSSPDMLKLLVEVGVNAFRLNFSHGSHSDHARSIDFIRNIENETGKPIAVIADMQGPKIRCGQFKGGQIELIFGQEITIINDNYSDADNLICIPHKELFEVLKPGNTLKFDDGKIKVTVKSNDGSIIKAVVDVPGTLKNKKGVNVIDAVLPMSAMTDKDTVDILFALSKDVDYIALSFVQTAKDVLDAREIIGNKANIIVKIEKPSAVRDIDSILDLADGVMVARGDLGVELPLEDVPVVQRKIIRKARLLGKPVIVATHMLESMIDSPTPTRAEASDVATAIYQGADVVMLSAETAVGRHPATAVAIMDRIIKSVEGDPEFWDYFSISDLPYFDTPEDAISQSVCVMSKTLNCKAVFGYTNTGSTVQRISRERPPCRIIGLTPSIKTARVICLNWGVIPLIMEDPKNFDEMLPHIQKASVLYAGLKSGDKIIITAGIPFGRPGTTNTLKIDMVD